MENTARTLDSYLTEEIAIYKEYLKVLEEERNAVRASKTDDVLMLSSQRDDIIRQMRECNERRYLFLKELSKDRHIKLSVFIKTYLPQSEQAKLQPKCEELKRLVRKCQSKSSELGQVVNFALKMAGGLISIIWSATQSVVHSYTARGSMKESYHPTTSKSANILKKA